MTKHSEPLESRVRQAYVLVALIVFAAVLRFHGLDWGLPDQLEEATPFSRAWAMADWGTGRPFDADPHYYRYPSLVFYIHLAAHAMLVAIDTLRGGAQAVTAIPIEFLEDKSRFLYASRVVSALFGIATVAGVFAAAARIGGLAAAVPAATFLAVSAKHVERSQFIDVDGPLACFVAWTLWACLRLSEQGTWRRHAVAGVLTGLGASAKYPGALLGVPVFVASMLATRSLKPARRVALVGIAGAMSIVTFSLTSPYLIKNSRTALADFNANRHHMKVGHFGQEDRVGWTFYGRHLVFSNLGVPLAAASLVGTILGLARRRSWAFLLFASFLVNAAVFASWRTMSERYLWPMTIPLVLLGAGLVSEWVRGDPAPWKRRLIVMGATLLFALPTAANLPQNYERIRPDPRTQAREWIERELPAGSFLVMEGWGPDLLGPSDIMSLSPMQRRHLIERGARPIYAFVSLPMYEVMPDLSEAFYDVALYPDADAIVLSSAMSMRYMRDPVRFVRQNEFYAKLERQFTRVAEFGPGEADRRGRDVPHITIYRRGGEGWVPFAKRKSVTGSVALAKGLRRPREGEAAFYCDVGLQYEAFGFLNEAAISYGRGLAVGASGRDLRELTLGITRCLLAQRREADAIRVVETLAAKAGSAADERQLREIAARLKAAVGERKGQEDNALKAE